MTGANGATPVLNSVTLAYLPQNSPPVLKSINVVSQAVTTQAPATASSSSGIFRHRDAIPAMPPRTPPALPRRPCSALTQQVTIAWQADDPDGDRLIYNVYFRGDDEMQWKVLKTATHETSLTFDADFWPTANITSAWSRPTAKRIRRPRRAKPFSIAPR